MQDLEYKVKRVAFNFIFFWGRTLMRNKIFNIAVLVALLINLILIDKGPSYIPIRKRILILALIIGIVDLLYRLYLKIKK